MMPRSILYTGLFLVATACGSTEIDHSATPLEVSRSALAASSVEDVRQYDDCRDNGHSSTINLGKLNADRDPATRAMFTTASCIVGRLTQFRGRFRPYNLQSFKNTTAGQTFFFKRISDNIIGEPPSECLKIKLSATVSPTDVYVTIDRVKQLPPPRTDGLCADNGEI